LCVNGFEAEDHPYISEVALAGWNRHIPFMPAAICGVFDNNFSCGIRLEINFRPAGFGIILNGREKGRFDGSAHIDTDDLHSGAEDKSSLNVAPAYQGQGIGKGWIKSRVELSHALGQSRFAFNAGLGNGAYTWPRARAELDLSPIYAEERQFQSHRMMARIDSLRECFTLADYNQMRPFCRLLDRQDPVRLAECDAVVPAHVKDDLQNPDSEIYMALTDFFKNNPLKGEKPWNSAATERRAMIDAFTMAAYQKKPLTLGRVVLSGMVLHLDIDYNCKPQMEQVGAYLGGWRTIEPA